MYTYFSSCTFKVGMYKYFYFIYIQGWSVNILILYVYLRLVCAHTFLLVHSRLVCTHIFTSCTFKVGMYTYFYLMYIQGWFVHILLLHVHLKMVCTHTFTPYIQGWHAVHCTVWFT